MNDIAKYVKLDGEFAISSLEIADACGKRHDHVMRDIKTMVAQLGEDAPKFGGIYTDPMNREKPCYYLPHNLMVTVVTGYDVVRRKKVIDRWVELEKEAVRPAASRINVRDPLYLNQVALQLIEVNQELQAQVAGMLPDVKAFERIAKADGSLCITDAAKTLQSGQKKLTSWLREHKWIYSRPGSTRPVAYQDHISRGHLENKVNVYLRDDVEHTSTQVRVTPKGLTILAKEFGVTLA